VSVACFSLRSIKLDNRGRDPSSASHGLVKIVLHLSAPAKLRVLSADVQLYEGLRGEGAASSGRQGTFPTRAGLLSHKGRWPVVGWSAASLLQGWP